MVIPSPGNAQSTVHASWSQSKERWRQTCLQSSIAASGLEEASLHGCRNPSPTPSRCNSAENMTHNLHDQDQTHTICLQYWQRSQEGMAANVPCPQATVSKWQVMIACTVAAICLCPPHARSPPHLLSRTKVIERA